LNILKMQGLFYVFLNQLWLYLNSLSLEIPQEFGDNNNVIGFFVHNKEKPNSL